MGVPALFRWLSKKYPKIIYSVEEEEEVKITSESGEEVVVPLNMSDPNPNGAEFDNLYLDMNGIVHPCSHPEGKAAPETEEDMMIEIFKYTERIMNMVRPRKLLFMAIDGVAPRAKMNQQRSRRFRSAQEAEDKEIARKESVLIWESMGKTISDDEKNKVSWDSNAITPGTPFMALLAASLRYWVVQKMNTDPGWKKIQVIISDASVPGEGEHKIMDFIRRQRVNPGHNPNTRHVIYGLDADLIMLALATHEPWFRVLREDVFFSDTSPTACRACGQEGHYSAQCTGESSKVEVKKTPSDKKPFIFLDVAILREYLEVELNVVQAMFPFSLEQAIDDWVLLIFFVGNDFLPHLPSLEIREGAIDTLLKIWKTELPRMGGYLTNHGKLELSRAQVILDGLAQREDEIFRRRREAEERQDSNAKRRKLDQQRNIKVGSSSSLQLNASVTASGSINGSSTASSIHPSLPTRPVHDFAAKADSIGFGAAPTVESVQAAPTAVQALGGSNRDIVANRRAIRMANMSAAEVLKAELSGLSPVKPTLPPKPDSVHAAVTPSIISPDALANTSATDDMNEDVPGLGSVIRVSTDSVKIVPQPDSDPDADADGEDDPDHEMGVAVSETSSGVKRKFDEEDVEPDTVLDEEEDVPVDPTSNALKVNADGTVEQTDTVKLWEPGYKERYYQQKFGVEPSDEKFRKEITKAYIEGLAWVLHYYFQGTPSWQWYYPYHFAPFAADFIDVDKMDIKFELGQPFKPFEQLMGVFPAASRQNIPSAFHSLMTEEESPIIDFYPTTFEIDMNGKKMAWQGVALLPFIDPARLLEAMTPLYNSLTEEEVHRNRWGNNVIFASDEHPLYPFYEELFGKRKSSETVPIDTELSGGISGSVLPDPECLPGSTYESPLQQVDLPNIPNDVTLSVLYFFPKQLTPHRSRLLPGLQRAPRVLTSSDIETTRNGGRGRGRGGYDRGGGGRGGYSDRGGNNQFQSRPTHYGGDRGDRGNRGGYSNNGDRGYGNNGYNDRGGNSYNNQPSRGGYQQPSQYGGYGSNNYAPPAQYNAPSSHHNSSPPQYNSGNSNYGGSSHYGGAQQNYSAQPQYGSYVNRNALPARGGAPTYGQGQSYGQQSYPPANNRSTYGGYGANTNTGGYGQPPAGPTPTGYVSSYSTQPRGHSSWNSTPARGRGRGW